MSLIKIRLSFPSLSLLYPIEINIRLPNPFAIFKKPYPTIWLLHCAMENGEFFFESLGAGELSEKYGFALVAPTLHNNYFLNHPHNRQADFLDEMKKSLTELLPLSITKEDNFVLGISMGAFGALRWALINSNFMAAVCISGVFNPFIEPDPRYKEKKVDKILHRALKDVMRASLLDDKGQIRKDADFSLLCKNSSPPKPLLYFYCGDEDYLSLPQTLAINEKLSSEGFKTFLSIQSGSHNKSFWRVTLHEVGKALSELSNISK